MKLKVVYAGDHVYTDFRIGAGFGSETDSAYNGIAFGIMDVLIWYAIMMETKKICVTRKTEIDFIEPVLCEVPYRAVSKVLNCDARDIHVLAWIEDESGRVCIRVKALFREGKGVSLGEILKDFDFSETTPEMKRLFYSFIE